MLRLGGVWIWVGWLVGWVLVFLMIEGETPLEVEAKLKGTLGWEVPWFWPVGRFLSGCSDPDSGRTLFKLQVFKDEKTWSKQRKQDDAKKPQPRQIFKVDWKTDRRELAQLKDTQGKPEFWKQVMENHRQSHLSDLWISESEGACFAYGVILGLLFFFF